jgi:hypothetical protein
MPYNPSDGSTAFPRGLLFLARRWTTAAFVVGCVSSLQGEIARQGTEYVVGRMRGDQVHPVIQGNAQGLVLAWQDNATDGDGSGISARLMTPSGVARGDRFRVNESGAGEQENASVAMFKDGASLFVWQSGTKGQQQIRYRILGADGVFQTPELGVHANGSDDARNAVAVVLEDGSAVIAWSAFGFDGDMAGIALQKIARDGSKVGSVVQANEFTPYNQRNPTLAALSAGFVVGWVSEMQTGENRSDIYLRRFNDAVEPMSPSVRANSNVEPATSPRLSVVDGQIWASWSRIQRPDTTPVLQTIRDRARWVLQFRKFSAELTPLGSETRLSDQTKGNQIGVTFAESGDRVMAVWSTDQFDGSSLGVAGRFMTRDGQVEGNAFVVNSITREDQIQPTVASAGDGRFMVAWSDWRGLDDGMEIAIQRFAPTALPLTALPAPVVSGHSSWQVKAAWAPLQGMSISHYEVEFDASSTFTTSNAFWESPDVLPGSLHKVRVRYVLPDGRKSPLSAEGSGRAWGKDNNGDGLPDDWQSSFFGVNALAWPKANADTDGDGVSDRNEFLGGTDPKDPADNLSVQIQSTEQGPVLVWKTKVGGVYQLQHSDNLQSWTDVGGYRFATGESDSLVTPGLPANTYFRVNRIR